MLTPIEMMHMAPGGTEEALYCFSIPYVQFPCYMGYKIADGRLSNINVTWANKITRPVATIKSLTSTFLYNRHWNDQFTK